MKYNLLKLVQKVLSSMSSDEVNDIAETVESLQVVDIIEDVYYNLIVNNDVPEHEVLIQVEALADSSKPNYLKLPSSVSKIDQVWYNVSETGELEYKQLEWLSPAEFLRRNSNVDTSASNVVKITDFGSTKFAVVNDHMPTYWTTFDDEYLVFDSYDSDIDSTLQQTKTRVIAKRLPTFERTNSYIPDIDDNLFPILLNEAKSWAHLELKQTAHAKAEQQSRRQRTRYQKERTRITKPNSRPDYGRR